MPILEQHPPHIRRKVALLCTGGVALILLVVLIFYYTSPKRAEEKTQEPSKIEGFYDSIQGSAESLFDAN